MHRAVKLELDKSSALELPAFEPEEIDYWLNRAINDYVKGKCEKIEKDQSFIDDLRTLYSSLDTAPTSSLVISSDLTQYVVDISGIYDPTYPYPYFRFLRDEIKISYTDSVSGNVVTKWVGNIEVTQDNYNRRVENPYSEHRLHYGDAKPLRYFYGDYVFLLTDNNYSITEYRIVYFRKPVTVSISTPVDCDLPEHTHQEIVKLTTLTLMENIESIRSQTFLRSNKIN